jgi:hypothetical protein
MKTLWAVVASFLLGGCMTGGALMRHPTTGETVECGRYVLGSPLMSMTMEKRERACIEDFRSQGYERRP